MLTITSMDLGMEYGEKKDAFSAIFLSLFLRCAVFKKQHWFHYPTWNWEAAFRRLCCCRWTNVVATQKIKSRFCCLQGLHTLPSHKSAFVVQMGICLAYCYIEHFLMMSWELKYFWWSALTCTHIYVFQFAEMLIWNQTFHPTPKKKPFEINFHMF